MNITKNYQSPESLRAMTASAFPGHTLASAVELTEGLCNAAYMLTLDDARRVVLKITPKGGAGLMTNEVRLMDAEVEAMRLVKEAGATRVAEVYRHDKTHTLCSSDYFLMEALDGLSMFSQREISSPEERLTLHREVGQIARRVGNIHNDTFGMLGDTEHRFSRLYDFIRYVIENVLADAARKQIDIASDPREILRTLERDAACFDEVTQPSLIHWDMWEGNIFIRDGHVIGVIDWERAMWAEPYMDDRFRRHTRVDAFLEGFGQTAFTPSQCRRILWYDIFLYLTMMTEPDYRMYPDDSQYRWVRPLFEQSWSALLSGATSL